MRAPHVCKRPHLNSVSVNLGLHVQQVGFYRAHCGGIEGMRWSQSQAKPARRSLPQDSSARTHTHARTCTHVTAREHMHTHATHLHHIHRRPGRDEVPTATWRPLLWWSLRGCSPQHDIPVCALREPEHRLTAVRRQGLKPQQGLAACGLCLELLPVQLLLLVLLYTRHSARQRAALSSCHCCCAANRAEDAFVFWCGGVQRPSTVNQPMAWLASPPRSST